ncbi:MAG: hypothetical protein ACJ796_20790 [Gemmatimonadaceae bacterium]
MRQRHIRAGRVCIRGVRDSFERYAQQFERYALQFERYALQFAWYANTMAHDGDAFALYSM